MDCRKCKKEMPERSAFCLHCGAAQTTKKALKPDTVRRKRSTFTYNGKRYEATGATQKEADKNAAIMQDKLERGEVGLSGIMTVERWSTEWLETYKKPSVGTKTYKEYKRYCENIICKDIGTMRLCDVKDVDLQKILNKRQGNSYSDVKCLRDIAKALFKQAKNSRLITHNPAESIILPTYKKGNRRSITDFERKHFLIAATTHHAGLMYKMMLYCGLRNGEVCALSWKDIDFNERRVNVASAIESGTNEMKDPKTEAGIRSIPLPDAIYQDLYARKSLPFSPVFTQPTTGRRHTETSRQKAWKSLKKEIDISMGAKFDKVKAKDGKMRMTQILSVVADDFVPYCLRHTYCTDLQTKGVPINVAKYLMGHSDISVTANIYTDTTKEVINDAADLINEKPKKQDACGQ